MSSSMEAREKLEWVASRRSLILGALGCVGAGAGAAVGCFALSNRVLQPILRWESYAAAPGAQLGSVAWPAHVRGIA